MVTLRLRLLLLCSLLISCVPRYAIHPENVIRKNLAADKHPGRFETALALKTDPASNGVFSLENGGESLVARAWLCDHTQRTLDIQYYIFSRDNTGLIACDYIVRAADRGVKVRILVDDIATKMGTKEILLLDSHENIEIKLYNPGIRLGNIDRRIGQLVRNFGRLQKRMHVKTITFDGLVTILGGRNIADEYFDYDRKYNFRDRDVLLTGPVVKDVAASFELYWNDRMSIPFSKMVRNTKKRLKDPHRFDNLHRYACDTANFSERMRGKIRDYPNAFKQIVESGELVRTDRVCYVADEPDKNTKRKSRNGGLCTDTMIALFRQAKESITIQSPYLITTKKGKALLRDAVTRGVKVRVLTNSLAATDNFEAFSGYQRDRKKTLKTGIEIYEWKPDGAVKRSIMMPEVQSALTYTPVLGLHAKSMIIDEKVSVIASFNLDPRSARLNTECAAIIRSEAFTKTLSKYVEEEFKPGNCWRVTEDFNPDKEASLMKRIKVFTRRVFPKALL